MSLFLRSTTRLIGHLEVIAQRGPLRCGDVCIKGIDQGFALVVESRRRITRCTFLSEREESRAHSTAVAINLMVLLLTSMIRASGSVIRIGMQSICRTLMPFLHPPALGSSAASLTQTPRDAAFLRFLSLLAVARGVRDHRGSFFGIVGTTASASALSSTSLSTQLWFLTFSVGLVSLGWLVHSE